MVEEKKKKNLNLNILFTYTFVLKVFSFESKRLLFYCLILQPLPFTSLLFALGLFLDSYRIVLLNHFFLKMILNIQS